MSAVRRNGLLAVVAVALTGTLLLSGCAPSATAAQTAATPTTQATGSSPARTITVVGRGEVSVQPAVAHTNIGVEVTAPTVAEALSQANQQMASVVAALKAQGIAQKDIQTSNFSINFERQGPVPVPAKSSVGAPETGTAGQYHVSNMVQVTVRDLDKVGSVLDAAVAAGANNVWGVNFGLDNTDQLESQAREKAIADARSRAESLARLSGVTIGNVISVSEVVGNNGPIYADAAMAKGMGGGTPVEPGEVQFTTQVQVVYAIQ